MFGLLHHSTPGLSESDQNFSRLHLAKQKTQDISWNFISSLFLKNKLNISKKLFLIINLRGTHEKEPPFISPQGSHQSNKQLSRLYYHCP